MIKPVFQWEPKAASKRRADGTETGELHGVFRTKVSPSTPGAIHYSGKIAATGKDFDYWAKEATVIHGRLRWVDKVLPPFQGATAQIALFVESEKALHKIAIPYDAGNLHNVMNLVTGLGKSIETDFLSITYWVRKKIDNNGRPVVMDNGNIRYLKTLQFQDVAPKYSFEEWKDFAQKNALEWEQRKRADGKTEWVADAALKFWDSKIVAVQRYLLQTDYVLPFTYGSLIACEAANPSGGGNLTPEEIETAKVIYERRKSDFSFPYGNRSAVSADDIMGEDYAPPATVHVETARNNDFPVYEPGPVDAPVITEFNNDDLPF